MRKNGVDIYVGTHQQEDTAKAFVFQLKCCALQKDLKKGSSLHEEILKTKLLESNQFVGNALISMYSKCGAFTKAQDVLEKLPTRNVVSWSALIAGYATQGCGEEALKCYRRMQDEHLPLNAVTCISLLKACGTIGALDEGELIHDMIMRDRLMEGCIELGGALVDMYAKCGSIAKARDVLAGLTVRDVRAWSSLIAGYAQDGHGEQAALHCLELMKQDGLNADAGTFACALKACRSLEKGKYIHCEIVKQGFCRENTILGGALVAMYAKCGALAEAAQVLRKLPAPDVVAWTALMAGYTQHDQCKEALNCFEDMQRHGICPNEVTLAFFLKACGSIGDLTKGIQMHGEILRKGLLVADLELGGALVDMYAKCGALRLAHELLGSLHVQSVVTWSALISGYAERGRDKEALTCFEQMKREGFSPDIVTFVCILKAFVCVKEGAYIHVEIVKQGLLRESIILGDALVAMYARCGALAEAAYVLNKLPVRDVGAWSALLAGYTQHDQGREALNCFEEMQHEGVPPNSATFTCVLKACGSLHDLNHGKHIHCEIARKDLLAVDLVVGGALIDMYVKCGALKLAREVLKSLNVRSVFAWSTLIAGYTQFGQGAEALDCFEQMQSEGLRPDLFTLADILKACGSIGATEIGERFHAEAKCKGLLGQDIVVGNALLDMYVKCGALTKAQHVLNELPVRDVVAWTSMVAGYGQQGQAEEAVSCFEQMQEEGVTPNEITFACLLNACGHAGLVETGQMYYNQMSSDYGVLPDAEHHSCLVDLFARAGHLEEAVSVIKKIPHCSNLPVWSALLGACEKWGSVNLGRFAFEHATRVN